MVDTLEKRYARHFASLFEEALKKDKDAKDKHIGQQIIVNGVTPIPQTYEERIREMEAENKQLHLQLETITKDRDYYRDAYHHLLRERDNDG